MSAASVNALCRGVWCEPRPIWTANFLVAAVGDDAVADAITAAPCVACGKVHVHSSLGSGRMETDEWQRYRVLCGRDSIVAARPYEIGSGVEA